MIFFFFLVKIFFSQKVDKYVDDKKLVSKSKSNYCQVCKINKVSTIPRRRTHCRSCGNVSNQKNSIQISIPFLTTMQLVCPPCSEKEAIFRSKLHRLKSHNVVKHVCDPCFHDVCYCFCKSSSMNVFHGYHVAMCVCVLTSFAVSHVLLFNDTQSNFEEKFMILTIRLGKISIYSYQHQDFQTHNTALADPELEIMLAEISDVRSKKKCSVYSFFFVTDPYFRNKTKNS